MRMTKEEQDAFLKRYPDAPIRLNKVFNLLLEASQRPAPPDEESNEPPKPKATRAKRKPKSSD